MNGELTRRDFILATTAATTAAIGGLTAQAAAPEEQRRESPGKKEDFIDTNVTLGHWPFRGLPLDQTPSLASKLVQHGVAQAWAGTFDGLLHKDISSANARLARECLDRGGDFFLPFGSVNPMLPGWEEDLRRCHETHKMRGLRLHPNYHGCKLDSPQFAQLLDQAEKRRLIVQIALSMEDERTQSRLMPVPHADPSPLPSMLKAGSPPIVLLNWWRAVKPAALSALARAPRVYFDIATVENVAGIELLLGRIPANRLVFGSQSPLFYFESALLRLRESVLAPETLSAIKSGNAREILAWSNG